PMSKAGAHGGRKSVVRAGTEARAARAGTKVSRSSPSRADGGDRVMVPPSRRLPQDGRAQGLIHLERPRDHLFDGEPFAGTPQCGGAPAFPPALIRSQCAYTFG